MNIYIISNIDLEKLSQVCKEHTEATNQIEQNGNNAVSITDMPLLEDYSNAEALQHRLKLLGSCQAVLVLPNWQEDKFARIEVATAYTLGLSIIKANGTIIPPQITFYV